MNELRTLLEEFWICRDADKEEYYRVRRDVPNFQKFVREQLGWKLIHTENLIKLEKVPAYAESFMGIQEFTEIRDYCILCVVLMFLEDREEEEQFLLSELIDYVETQLKVFMQIDWTSFTQRKSLVRVLQYLEKLHVLRVYEGSSEAFGQEAGRRSCMKTRAIPNILPQASRAIFPDTNPGRTLRRRTLRSFPQNGGRDGCIAFTDNLWPVRPFTGKKMTMRTRFI